MSLLGKSRTRTAFFICAVTLALAVCSFCRTFAEDVIIADFEGSDYGSWRVEGEAFGTEPARGTLTSQMTVSGYQGERLANSYFHGDASVGVLTSPEIEITKPYVNFLIGGGAHPGTYFEMLVDGKRERLARGPNLNPGGSEKLDWETWDVADFIGQKVVFRIVDNETGGWGHINVDSIMQSDKRRSGLFHLREAQISAPYLIFYVAKEGEQRWVRIEVDGKVVREFTASLPEAGTEHKPGGFNACVDMSPWVGKTLSFIVEKADDELELEPLRFSDSLYDSAPDYNQPLRPQFHFSPREGWTNDPNGLVYANGVYHLFYQHNPFHINWGNMTWGHATSPDLMHWTEQGDALYADELGTIFSGSGAVDVNNSAGFQTDPQGPAPLVFMYTYNGPSMRYGNRASQALAYSLDNGKTLIKYEGNPTLPHIIGGNRDPKIFWYEPTQKWIVALYMDGEDYALFASDDLKSWEELCRIEKMGCSECPDIFELAVDGDESNKLWVFWGGDGRYVLGHFDGHKFEPITEPQRAKFGGNDYAAQSYSDTPGRRVQFSWMNGGQYPDMPFNQQFSVPRELTLRTTEQGVRLCIYPVKEVNELRDKAVALQKKEVDSSIVFEDKENVAADLLDVELTLNPTQDAESAQVKLRDRVVTVDFKAQTVATGDVTAPIFREPDGVKLRLVLDRTSLEVFVNGGTSQIATCYLPSADAADNLLSVEAKGGKVDVAAQVWTVKSVWK